MTQWRVAPRGYCPVCGAFRALKFSMDRDGPKAGHYVLRKHSQGQAPCAGSGELPRP